MKIKESISFGIIKRIVFFTIILLIIFGVAALAGTKSVNSVTIEFSDGTELTVITSKTNVNDILKENNIYLLENEIVSPDVSTNIDSSKRITISRKEDIKEETSDNNEISIIESTKLLEVDQTNKQIVESIVKEREEIPYETITKEVSNGNGEKTSKVVQEGKNGIKEITYKVKYQEDILLEKTFISEEIIQEPVNKIVNVTVTVSSRGDSSRGENVGRSTAAVSGTKADYQAYARQRCNDYGWSESDYYSLVALWNKESGWNPTSRNRSSGAYGIPQALPAGKMASAGSDYLTNYKTQINWGLSYIKGRYGNPSNAYNHLASRGWY